MKITVIFPTRSEAMLFDREDVEVRFCGVGLTASAHGTLKAINETKPDMIIMAGIAGVYEGRQYKIGDTLLVESECEADLGFFYEDGFRRLVDCDLDMDFDLYRSYDCPHIKEDMPLRRVRSITTNAAMSPYADTSLGDIENMEGSAFFYVAMQEGVPFLQVRSISNTVDLGRGDWDYKSSIENMTDGLNKIIDYLQRETKA